MKRSSQKGVSLLEALVSLVVMAIGTVAALALQTTLRSNADMAKQRSEAVRLAQRKIEEWRGYAGMPADGAQLDWSDIADTIDAGLVGTSATFDRTATVISRGEANDDARSKTVRVMVAWTDRAGQAQSVELRSVIAGVPPELAGSLSIAVGAGGAGSLLPNPGGRHAGIPRDATLLGDGTSSYTPPGAPADTQWIFDNTTGVIRNICTPSCPGEETKAQFVTGFVRFALAASPSSAESENPTDAPLAVSVMVDQDVPYDQNVSCYSASGPTYLQYFCAVPVTSGVTTWNGQIKIDESTLQLASTVLDSNASKYRACRYTPVRGCHPAVGSTIWGAIGQTASCTGSDPTPKRKMTNEHHPLLHSAVSGPLLDQNFLVIRAGDGTSGFDCPDDDASTPAVQGTTWHHQPAN